MSSAQTETFPREAAPKWVPPEVNNTLTAWWLAVGLALFVVFALWPMLPPPVTQTGVGVTWLGWALFGVVAALILAPAVMVSSGMSRGERGSYRLFKLGMLAALLIGLAALGGLIYLLATNKFTLNPRPVLGGVLWFSAALLPLLFAAFAMSLASKSEVRAFFDLRCPKCGSFKVKGLDFMYRRAKCLEPECGHVWPGGPEAAEEEEAAAEEAAEAAAEEAAAVTGHETRLATGDEMAAALTEQETASRQTQLATDRELAAAMAEGRQSARAVSSILIWAYGHQNEFYGRRQEAEPPAGSWAGKWERTEQGEYIGFLPNRLCNLLVEHGYEIEPTLQAWRDRGWLLTDAESAENLYRTDIEGREVALYAINPAAVPAFEGEPSGVLADQPEPTIRLGEPVATEEIEKVLFDEPEEPVPTEPVTGGARPTSRTEATPTTQLPEVVVQKSGVPPVEPTERLPAEPDIAETIETDLLREAESHPPPTKPTKSDKQTKIQPRGADPKATMMAKDESKEGEKGSK